MITTSGFWFELHSLSTQFLAGDLQALQSRRPVRHYTKPSYRKSQAEPVNITNRNYSGKLVDNSVSICYNIGMVEK